MSSLSEASYLPVVAYVRMSTDHQQYSTSNQLDFIREYASAQKMEIKHVYEDDGKSGLSLQGRDEFNRLIEDITSGRANFKAVLVYDISRWGRFQDADESAHLEFICKRAGVIIHFCAEQFTNDGSTTSTIIKSVKRLMAGEYSRELSTKVFRGACRLIELGYRQGGVAGYGLRRMLVDHQGITKGVLPRGQHKSIQTDRVILVPGPIEEVETVRWLYAEFTDRKRSETDLANELNARGRRTDLGKTWSRALVRQILTNEKYCGHNLYHRTSFRLKQKHIINPPDQWIRKPNAFQPIVDDASFQAAQKVMLQRAHRLSDLEMLEGLRKLWRETGQLTGIIIDESEYTSSSAAYRHRFGSLARAYQLIGYISENEFQFLEINRRLRTLHSEVVGEVMEEMQAGGNWIERDAESDILTLNSEITISLLLCRCVYTSAGSTRWVIRLEPVLRPDFSVAVRMQPDNATVRDFYVLPSMDIRSARLRLSESNGFYLDAYRHETLGSFFEVMQRSIIPDVI